METLKTFSLILLSCISIFSCQSKKEKNFITSDIQNFWNAFDSVQNSSDSTEQIEILQTQFFDKASPGQKAMFEARNYTPQEYLQAIKNHPEFWKSIRQNTLNADSFSSEIEKGISKLKHSEIPKQSQKNSKIIFLTFRFISKIILFKI